MTFASRRPSRRGQVRGRARGSRANLGGQVALFPIAGLLTEILRDWAGGGKDGANLGGQVALFPIVRSPTEILRDWAGGGKDGGACSGHGAQIENRVSRGLLSRDQPRQLANEAKNGPTARLSDGQKDFKDDVANGRPVTPVGGNAQAAGFTPGQPTTFDRFVEWIFGKDKK